jgi:hypothetical protein
MIGALTLAFGGIEAGFVGFGGIRSGQLCGVGVRRRVTPGAAAH